MAIGLSRGTSLDGLRSPNPALVLALNNESFDRRSNGGDHDQEVARAIPTNRIISKKMMKVGGGFGVK
jgi:hypothetical protein